MIINALGNSMTCREWASKTGLSVITIRSRIKRGWPPDRAVSEPANVKVTAQGSNWRPRDVRMSRDDYLRCANEFAPKPTRKVTDEMAREIRENRHGLTRKSLAAKYGLSIAGVDYVRNFAKTY